MSILYEHSNFVTVMALKFTLTLPFIDVLATSYSNSITATFKRKVTKMPLRQISKITQIINCYEVVFHYRIIFTTRCADLTELTERCPVVKLQINSLEDRIK